MSQDMQLDLFGAPPVPFDPDVTTAALKAAAEHAVQGALFRPTVADMRLPKRRGRAAAPVALDPALHDETLT